jgi:hypothetical protein
LNSNERKNTKEDRKGHESGRGFMAGKSGTAASVAEESGKRKDNDKVNVYELVYAKRGIDRI